MAVRNVPPLRGAAQIAALLDSPEIAGLIADLEATRWTGRPGYPIRAMVGLALTKSVYVIPTWSRTVRLVAEHAALQDALGVAPSVHAAYRFTIKLREHSATLADCLDRLLAGLHEAIPDLWPSRRPACPARAASSVSRRTRRDLDDGAVPPCAV